jgi:hypothetical protein
MTADTYTVEVMTLVVWNICLQCLSKVLRKKDYGETDIKRKNIMNQLSTHKAIINTTMVRIQEEENTLLYA